VDREYSRFLRSFLSQGRCKIIVREFVTTEIFRFIFEISDCYKCFALRNNISCMQ
jgi:hypothetical protein